MKAICKIKAYYNGAIIKPGETVNIKGNKLPSWAKGINDSAKKKEEIDDNTPKEVNNEGQISNENTTPEEVNEGENKEDNTPKEDEPKEGVNEESTPNETVDDLTGKTEAELSAILDDLLTQALDKGIEIEIGTKPIIDSIIELRQKLEGVNK